MVKTLSIQIDDLSFSIIDKRRIDKGVVSIEEYIKNLLLQVAQRIEKETTPTSAPENNKEQTNEEQVKKRLAELGYLD